MRRSIFVAVAVCTLGLVVALPAGTAGMTTYHGVFSAPVVYSGGGPAAVHVQRAT